MCRMRVMAKSSGAKLHLVVIGPRQGRHSIDHQGRLAPAREPSNARPSPLSIRGLALDKNERARHELPDKDTTG